MEGSCQQWGVRAIVIEGSLTETSAQTQTLGFYEFQWFYLLVCSFIEDNALRMECLLWREMVVEKKTKRELKEREKDTCGA